MATRTILLDVGGTFIKCDDGREVPIDSNGSREEITASLRKAVWESEGIHEGDDICLAAAVPGPFGYADGTFLMKHKFAAVYGEKFQDLVGVKDFHFSHDVNAMLFGELCADGMSAYRNVTLVTLGTGLGHSMAIDEEILTNELGSPLVSIYNKPYGEGTLEDYVSKRGFLRGMEGITVKELAQKAYNGDKKAQERFEECASILATALSPILTEYGIECLLLGGQISRSFSLMENTLKEKLSEVPSLKCIKAVSDIGNATFNGLKAIAKK